MKKKIAIISYATYPRNSPRAMRTHELSKELAAQGHEVSVYTLNGGYDYDSYNKKYNLNVCSLGKTYFIANPFSNNTASLTERVLHKLLNKKLAYPSIELVSTVYQALRKKILKNGNNIDLIITIAFPHSIHWGTALFKYFNKEKFKNITWVADCGDPYMGNQFLTPPNYFKYLEDLFLNQADYITVPIEEAKEAYSKKYRHKFRVIPQGFSFTEKVIKPSQKNNKIPTFIYAGTFYKNIRDPRPLLDYLSKMDKEFKFIVYTKNKSPLLPYIDMLYDKLKVLDYIPRDNLLKEMSKADFLLNLENSNSEQSPSKLIDYALSGSPILSVNTQDLSSIKEIDQFLAGNYSNQTVISNMDDYNIINVAKKFLNLNKTSA